jgi:hypothetical protein
MDYYAHVRARFMEKGIQYTQGHHAPLAVRKALWEELGKPELCGEPGLPCTGCVSIRDVCAMNLEGELGNVLGMQRKDCRCAAEKTELLKQRGQCAHGCVYCYWRS